MAHGEVAEGRVRVPLLHNQSRPRRGVHGRAIHGGGVATFQAPGLGWTIRAGGKDYLVPIRWHGSTLTFGWCGNKVHSARLPSTGQQVRVEQKEDRVWLHGLPVHPPDPYANPIELEWE